MTFDEACVRCPPGYCFKSDRCGWTEYTVQYGRDAKGELYWTAGGTTGGVIKEDMQRNERKLNGVYSIYKTPRGLPLTNLPSFEEAYTTIKKNSPETQAKAFIHKVNSVIEDRVDKNAGSGIDPVMTRVLCRDMTRDILSLLDTCTPYGQHVYNFSLNRTECLNMSGLLVGLFDSINS